MTTVETSTNEVSDSASTPSEFATPSFRCAVLIDPAAV